MTSLDFSIIDAEVVYYRTKAAPTKDEYKLELVTFREFIAPYLDRVPPHTANPRRLVFLLLEQDQKDAFRRQQAKVDNIRTVKGVDVIKDNEAQLVLLRASRLIEHRYYSDVISK